MKHFVLYLMLLLAIPATAQHGLFGSHPHHEHAPKHPHHGSLMQHGPHEHHQGPQAMSSEDFEVALRYIAKESFDDNRLEVAKQVVKDNWVNAKQIATICERFTFDSNRVEFAKYAYASCVNRGMYFVVEETFTFSSSKEELRDYINKY